MLSYEEIRKGLDEVDKKLEERDKQRSEERREELKRMNIEPFKLNESQMPHYDHPNTMENGTATFFWIVVMLVGSIFKGNWVIWIVSTVIWAKFITRHNKK